MSDLKRSSDQPDDEIVIDLRQNIKVLRKWSKMIIAITMLTTLASGIISVYFLQPVYQAKTLLMVTVASEKLQVTTNSVTRTDPATGATSTAMPVLTMNTYLGQLESEVVMSRVITALNLSDQTINSLSSKIEASIVKDSNLIEVKVNQTDPVMAARIANTLSTEYLQLMKEFMFSSVVVISPANVPTKPVKPNKTLNVTIAFILGLILSVMLAFLLEYMDNTLKSPEDISRELEIPLLGLIPIATKNNTKQSNYGGRI